MGDVFGGVRGVVHNGRHRGGFVFFDDLDSRGKFILLGTKKGFRFSGLMIVVDKKIVSLEMHIH